jgi:hypothetical protein
MRILIVSQYFWPEAFRINEVATSLREPGCEVAVLIGQPNYPEGVVRAGYRAASLRRDAHEGIPVFRVPLAPRGRGPARARPRAAGAELPVLGRLGSAVRAMLAARPALRCPAGLRVFAHPAGHPCGVARLAQARAAGHLGSGSLAAEPERDRLRPECRRARGRREGGALDLPQQLSPACAVRSPRRAGQGPGRVDAGGLSPQLGRAGLRRCRQFPASGFTTGAWIQRGLRRQPRHPAGPGDDRFSRPAAA